MTATQPSRSPWTIPIAEGPVAAWLDRTIAGAVALAASLCVGALAPLQPDARGHGTHEQLGWDACGWPIQYGIPCPTCGCTTAACLLVHGRVFAALAAQPFGAVLAAFGLVLGVHGALCLLRGRSFVDLLVRLPFWRLLGGAFVLMLLAWGYKYLMWEA